MAITLKICISDPMLVKPKYVLEASIYFHFSADCLQFSAVCLQFFKKLYASQMHFGFTNMGSEMHIFTVIAKKTFQILIWVTMYLRILN